MLNNKYKQIFYNGGKIALKSVYSRMTNKRMPLFSTLYITDICNQRCTHCGIHTVNQKIKELTTQEIKKNIDDLCSLGVEWFRFLGGEPLLRRDLKELIDHVSITRGKIAEIVTNGINIDKKMDALENLYFVGISIEGNKENHERIRGKDSFEKAEKAVALCTKAGKYVRIHMVLNRYNIQEDNIDFMIDFCRRYDVQFDFCRLMINPYYKPEYIPDYYYIPDDMARAFFKKILKRKIEEDVPISNSVRSLKLLVEYPYSYDKYTLYKSELNEHPEYKVPECTCGIFNFELSSDGKLRHCVNRYDKEIDVKQAGGIKNAWKILGDKDCHTCSHLSIIEQSLMLTLDPKSAINAFNLLTKKRKVNV
ncbi:MAG: radical SAM protein [Candidatus Omnitrophica bacterium]|nr:radical SAM protein [Candidatus Omnitrophota bacterium]